MKSRSICPFFTVFFIFSSSSTFNFDGLSKPIDFFRIDFSCGCGKIVWIEFTISSISFSKGLDIGPIYERLKAPIILINYDILTSLWFLRSSRTYYYKQLATILKSSTFSFNLSPKSIADCFRFVAVELDFNLFSPPFLLKLITLIVCFSVFFPFFAYIFKGVFCLPLLNLLAEWTELAKIIDGPKELICSCRKMERGYFSSVLIRTPLCLRSGLWYIDLFFLCLG